MSSPGLFGEFPVSTVEVFGIAAKILLLLMAFETFKGQGGRANPFLVGRSLRPAFDAQTCTASHSSCGHRCLSTLSLGFELLMRDSPATCTVQADFSRHVARGPKAKTVCPTSRPALGGSTKRAFSSKLSVSTFDNLSAARGCTTLRAVMGSQRRAGQGVRIYAVFYIR